MQPPPDLPRRRIPWFRGRTAATPSYLRGLHARRLPRTEGLEPQATRRARRARLATSPRDSLHLRCAASAHGAPPAARSGARIVVLALLGLAACLAACSPQGQSAATPLAPLPKATLTSPPVAVVRTSTLAPPPAAPSTASPPPCPTREEGGLISELDRIADLQPGPGTQGMAVPTDTQLAAWDLVLDAVARGDTQEACNLIGIHTLPYQLVEFTDLPFHHDRVLLLREVEPLTVGWGTYVYRLGSERDLVIEVPHPLEDSYTRGEGVTFFRELGAKALLVAGAHRCADAEFASCGGTTIACGQVEPYRVSDVAHSVRTMFHAAHRIWADCRDRALAIQLHGNDIATCPDLFISNGTRHPGALARAVQRSALRMCAPFVVDLADGIPADECGFLGNGAQAAYSLSCSDSVDRDACPDAPTRPGPTDRYLSLEQSMALRLDYGCLVAALDAQLP